MGQRTKMAEFNYPEAKNWNHYWSLDQTKKFSKVSWSKRRMMDVIRPYCVKNKMALDAGCGSGFFSKYFCDQGMVTTSLDYSASALTIAQQQTSGRARLIQADLVEDDILNQIKGRFDLIFSDGLLEHFSSGQQDKIMKNVRFLLKKEGILITFVPNRWSPWELIRPFFMPGIEEAPFTLNQLIELNQRNDFSILCKGGVNTVPFFISPDNILGQCFGMLLYTIAKQT